MNSSAWKVSNGESLGEDQEFEILKLRGSLPRVKKWMHLLERSLQKAEADAAERDVIITNLQALYFEWKEKFLNMDEFSNYVIWELPERLK